MYKRASEDEKVSENGMLSNLPFRRYFSKKFDVIK